MIRKLLEADEWLLLLLQWKRNWRQCAAPLMDQDRISLCGGSAIVHFCDGRDRTRERTSVQNDSVNPALHLSASARWYRKFPWRHIDALSGRFTRLWLAWSFLNQSIIWKMRKTCREIKQWINPVHINTSLASPPLRCQISVYKHFSGAGKMCINTSPAPERCFQILPRLFRRRISVFKYFSGAGEVLLIWYLSDSGEAWEVFKNTFLAPEKYLYTLFRRRKSAYIHLFGAGEAGEVFIYTQ